MATRAEKISARLPHFYLSWDRSSVVSSMVESMGKCMDDTEKEFVAMMRSHWVDTASSDNLDKMGALYSMPRNAGELDNDYRGRLKVAIISYKGGGTQNSIKMITRIALNLPPDYPVEIRENPLVKRKKTWKVRANTAWSVNPGSIVDSEPDISISLETKDARIANPTITNIDTGDAVTFNGDLTYGDTLKLSNGKALLNGIDKSNSLSSPKPISMPRRKNQWQYTESIGANIGVFDQAQFDRSVFAVDIMSSVTVEWTAYEPASFEVVLPKALLDKSGVKADYLQGLINSVKSGGVKGVVKVL
jgi:hypothetical protein